MKRKYNNTATAVPVEFFYGTEVEHSPAHGMYTLFVVGVKPVTEILPYANAPAPYPIKHIYCGANMSFAPKTPNDWIEWVLMVNGLLNEGFLVTLDFDLKYAEDLLKYGLCESNTFIPMVSIKLPYTSQFNYNTTIKIDDKGFDISNPGVWCHRLHDLLDTSKFTSWHQYKDDESINN